MAQLSRVCAAAGLAFTLASGVLYGQESAPSVPFTARVVQTRFRADGTQTNKEEFIYAMRADGSSATVLVANHGPGGAGTPLKSIVDVAAATHTFMRKAGAGVEKRPVTSVTLDVMRAQWTNCNAARYVERDTILQRSVVRVSRELPVTVRPDGDTMYLNHDEWQDPELRCYTLRGTTTFYTNWRPVARTVSEVVGLVLGEPDPKLFDPPK